MTQVLACRQLCWLAGDFEAGSWIRALENLTLITYEIYSEITPQPQHSESRTMR